MTSARLRPTQIKLGVFTAFHKESGETVLHRTYRNRGAATSALRIALYRLVQCRSAWAPRADIKTRAKELEADYEVRAFAPLPAAPHL